MKFRQRMMSLALALVMVCGLTVNVSAATTQNIKVQLSPNITVKLNGETQNMADVNGNPVYPLLNDGTTYLPVRAVSNMLGVGVDWDGTTQTVLLDTSKKTTPTKTDGKAPANAKPTEIIVQLSPNITVKLDGKAQSMTDVNGNPVYPILNGGTTYLPIRAVSNMLGVGVDWDGATQTVLLGKSSASDGSSVDAIREMLKASELPDDVIEAIIAGFETNDPNGDTKTLGDKHVANDYVEVDWSTADDGYVRVKLTKQKADSVYCSTIGGTLPLPSLNFELKLDKWVNIPLLNGNGEYQVIIEPRNKGDNQPVKCFCTFITANIKNPDAWMLLSSAKVDFENAPKTVAKAAELTKNCKTDAEKITAIFEFVAKTIKYDYKLADVHAVNWNLDLDRILNTKTGICEHYAVLMAGMLRSQGIPCKVVCGWAYNGENWVDHAWVSVSPDTKGLDMERLGAGHDEDGWIRLDPTWASTGGTYGRSQAAIDKNYETRYAY